MAALTARSRLSCTRAAVETRRSTRFGHTIELHARAVPPARAAALVGACGRSALTCSTRKRDAAQMLTNTALRPAEAFVVQAEFLPRCL